jgi:hypothetical protein
MLLAAQGGRRLGHGHGHYVGQPSYDAEEYSSDSTCSSGGQPRDQHAHSGAVPQRNSDNVTGCVCVSRLGARASSCHCTHLRRLLRQHPSMPHSRRTSVAAVLYHHACHCCGGLPAVQDANSADHVAGRTRRHSIMKMTVSDTQPPALTPVQSVSRHATQLLHLWLRRTITYHVAGCTHRRTKAAA